MKETDDIYFLFERKILNVEVYSVANSNYVDI